MPGVIQVQEQKKPSFLGQLLAAASPFIPGAGGVAAGVLGGALTGNPVGAATSMAGAKQRPQQQAPVIQPPVQVRQQPSLMQQLYMGRRPM